MYIFLVYERELLYNNNNNNNNNNNKNKNEEHSRMSFLCPCIFP